MFNVYYIYEKSRNLETIFICENNKYIEKPTIRTSIYPIGTILSRVMNLLSPWQKENFNRFSEKEIITSALKYKSDIRSSFPYITNDDYYLDKVFEIILKEQQSIQTNRDYNTTISLLRNYVEYIKLCQTNSIFFSIENLTFLSNKLGYTLPTYTIYSSDTTQKKDCYSREELEHILNNAKRETELLSKIATSKQKKIFSFPTIEEKTSAYGNIKLPALIFSIYDIVDFITASLQCLLEQNYYISKCHYCSNLFVTKNKKTLYCPLLSKNKTVSCSDKAKNERREHRKQDSECQKLHHKIRNKLAYRANTAYPYETEQKEKEYRYFLKTCQNHRNNIKHNISTEKEYKNWMEQYWEEIQSKENESKR